MNNIVIEINNFKEKIAKVINETKLPADIMKYVLQDYVNALTSLAMQQLYMAQKEKEDVQYGNSEN